MKTKIITVSFISLTVFMLLSTYNIVLATTELTNKYNESIESYKKAKEDYMKLRTLSQADKKRIESARVVVLQVNDTISSYTEIYNAKQNWLLANTQDFEDILGSNYTELTKLNEKVVQAKTLEELKTCLVDAKNIWNKIQQDCKLVQARWLMYSTKLSYNKFENILKDIELLSKEINKEQLGAINTEFSTLKNDYFTYYDKNSKVNAISDNEFKELKKQVTSELGKLKLTKTKIQELIKE